MEHVELDTTLFGRINFTNADGFLEDFCITLSGKEINIALYIWEDFITQENLPVVAAFLEELPAMYAKAKAQIAKDYSVNEVMKYFIQCQIEDIDEQCLLDYFNLKTIEELTPDLFITKLEPRTICIAPLDDQEAQSCIDCTFDFSIDEELSDELLVIRFDTDLEIHSISHES